MSGGSREPLIFAAARKSSRLPPLLQRRRAMSDTARRGRSPDLQLAGRIALAVRERHRHAVCAQHGGELALSRLVVGEAALQAFKSEEHTSELQSLMRISYAVFCLKKKTNK